MKHSIDVVNFHGVITASSRMKKTLELVQRVARTDSSVLLRGESGTGKELFAAAIHKLSPRKSKPFQALNCAALSKELMLSELFGHAKGAFTGAISEHQGLFQTADTGTIFLDEIAELPLDIQSKLLRVLQEKAFNKVGSTKVEHVDVRFVSATHTSLRQIVAEGVFREDLMYRIRVVPLYIPRLAERDRDVEVLTWRFIEEFNSLGGRVIKEVDRKALDAMLAYEWPGNIRELRNNIEHAYAVGEGGVLCISDLTPELQGRAPEGEVEYERLEKKQLLKALEAAHGHKGKAAQLCKMSRATFWRKCKLYQLY